MPSIDYEECELTEIIDRQEFNVVLSRKAPGIIEVKAIGRHGSSQRVVAADNNECFKEQYSK
jgi:hypothetical protein